MDGEVFLLVSGGVLIWHYAVYPGVLAIIARVWGTREIALFDDEELPPVSIVIIAHDEEAIIGDRIRNCLSVEYPMNRLEVIVASDGSTDSTVQRAAAIDGPVRVFDNPNGSKSETRNLAVERVSHDIVLFTDAETRYEPTCVRRIVDRYADPDVGAVGGALVTGSFEAGAIGRGMDLYWRWEYFMREQQGRLGRLVKMSGANMSQRKSFFSPAPDAVDVDQVAGLDTVRSGGKSVHAGDAVATEQFPIEPGVELEVRRRLTIRALSSLAYHRGIFNVGRYPFLAIHVSSYWLLRYLVPFLLVIFFTTSVLLAVDRTVGLVLVTVQLLVYGSAVVGYLFPTTRNVLPVSLAFSYCWANFGIARGVVAYLFGERFESY